MGAIGYFEKPIKFAELPALLLRNGFIWKMNAEAR
jgi:hypothetical protein